MGVSGLWELLKPIKQGKVSLIQCQGQKLAVDLSGWIVRCFKVKPKPYETHAELCCRLIFSRTLSLLSWGILPVFVLDGPQAPAVKKRREKREEFYSSLSLQYKELLTALGLPVLDCVGEAEKKCAQLNKDGSVDGCLTNDGDTFIYGAKVVYKGLTKDKQDYLADKYELADIQEKLGLDTNDLIAFALLSGGDMCKGVRGIGKEKFLKLKQELHGNGIGNILARIVSWKSDDSFTSLEKRQRSLSCIRKGRHCSKCKHKGDIRIHRNQGCGVCQTASSCTDAAEPGPQGRSHKACPCDWHVEEAKVKPFEKELKYRCLALAADRNFPEENVITEFQSEQGEDGCAKVPLSAHLPDFNKVCRLLTNNLRMSIAKTMSFMAPVLIKMFLHGMLQDLNPKPLRIEDECEENSVTCYRVQWKKLTCDEMTTGEDASCYTFPVCKELFVSKFRDMALEFDEKDED